MIAYVEGKFTYKSPTCVYIDVNGLGYEVQISLNTYSQIQELEKGKLLTYLHIKEDSHTLYGFFDKAEKDLFLLLISVSGVGAATTRMILSGMKPHEIQSAIIDENAKLLESIKGIGAKTAKRIILELKDKLIKSGIFSEKATETIPTLNNTLQSDALNALLALGIARSAADKAIRKALKNMGTPDSLEGLIKGALKNI